MIILEGPDGTGKTNLSRRLSAEFSLPIHERASSSLGGPVANLWDWTCMDVGSWDTQPLAIYDRHPLLSEYIYGPIARGALADGFTHPSAKGMIRRVASRALVIFCLPPIETVRRNVANEEVGQMAGVINNIDRIYFAYESLRANWAGWSVKYDYALPNTYDTVVRSVRLHQASFRQIGTRA